jgi:hypothetical protein
LGGRGEGRTSIHLFIGAREIRIDGIGWPRRIQFEPPRFLLEFVAEIAGIFDVWDPHGGGWAPALLLVKRVPLWQPRCPANELVPRDSGRRSRRALGPRAQSGKGELARGEDIRPRSSLFFFYFCFFISISNLSFKFILQVQICDANATIQKIQNEMHNYVFYLLFIPLTI